jgi:ketosteroid isomerase-like protein
MLNPVHPRHPDACIADVIERFESLSLASLEFLTMRYAADARFKDPFNDVRGRAAVRHVYEHMFQALQAPRFTILQALGGGAECMLTWDFDCRLRGRPLRIHGASHLRFDADGRIAEHRDYWDAAEEFHAKLPVLGTLMRWLQRRLAAPQP